MFDCQQLLASLGYLVGGKKSGKNLKIEQICQQNTNTAVAYRYRYIFKEN